MLIMLPLITTAQQLNFWQFLNNEREFEQKLNQKNVNISVLTAKKAVQQVRDQECKWKEQNNNIIIKPICLLKGILPAFDFTVNVDLLRPTIKGFPRVYDLQASSFVYEAIVPELDVKLVDDRQKARTDTTMLYYLALAQKADKELSIPKKFFALNLLPTYSFYAVKRSVADRWDCSQQNFEVALQALDTKTLQPGQELNINKIVANLPWYCKWGSKQDYLFYGGACGASTQLFRLSLLMPHLSVVERFGHSERYARYYSDLVVWDDAAIYQMSKQFIVKNTSNEEIYFRTRQQWDERYLIGITANKSQDLVRIEKRQVDNLAWQVKKIVYKSSGLVKSTNSRLSNYLKKNYQQN